MFLKQSTAVTILIGPFLDDDDGTAETGLTISQADVRLSKNAGNMAQKNESTSCTHDELGYYTCPLDATDTNTVGKLKVMVHESGALPVWQEFHVIEEAIYDALFAASSAGFDANQRVNVGQWLSQAVTLSKGNKHDVNVDEISDDATAATNLESYCDGTTPIPANATQISGDATAADNLEAAADGTGYNLGGGDIVAASVTGAVGSATGAVGSVTGAVGSVTGNVGGNVAGSVASVVGAVGSVTGAVGSVTGNVGGNVAGSVASVTAGVTLADDAITAAKFDEATAYPLASADTGATAVARTGADSDTLETLSDEIAALPTDADVQTAAAAALTAYDPPTNAEMVLRTLAAADYATAAALTTVDNEIATIDGIVDQLLALLDDARTEPGQGAPPVNPDAVTKIDYLYKAWRNKIEQTATEQTLYADDGTTADQRRTVSDDGTTFTAGEMGTGA
jgi:hypothetical protein